MNFSKRFSKVIRRVSVMLVVMVITACAGHVKKGTENLLEIEAKNKQAELASRFERALSHQNDSEYDEAEVIYKSLLDEDESLISPTVNLGIIAVNTKRLNVAKGFFEKALELDATHKLSLNYLGYIARDSGAFDKAEGYYRKILEIDPNDQLAIRNLGILLDLYRGRLEEALALYKQYQSLQTEADPQVKDWIFDTKNRLKAK